MKRTFAIIYINKTSARCFEIINPFHYKVINIEHKSKKH